jgi:hypothetical protein
MDTNINKNRHHGTMKTEPQPTSVFKYREKFITTWPDGTFTVSLMKYESFEAAQKAIDKILNNSLMIGRIK